MLFGTVTIYSDQISEIMRSTGNTNRPIGANKREITQHPGNKADELKTDPPLSEKDEVKQAETKLQKGIKKPR
jgi:hypothetical protein